MVKFSIEGMPVFPHIKLTREPFPRFLATRILQDDGDEYFGAFLNRTSVRILIDFLNRTYRLRSCAIAIDGSFPVPCTQYYAKRCVAPCVESLCDRKTYLEMVDLVRLFLRNDRELLRARLNKKIERAAASLDFETAALFRDILQSVDGFWSKPRWHVWLDAAVDTFELHTAGELIYVIVISQRGRRTLGEMVYAFPRPDDSLIPEILHDVIPQFYKYHLPREIRVSHDFKGRGELAAPLGAKFGKKITINVVTNSNRRVTTARAIDLTKARLSLERAAAKPSVKEIQEKLKETFALSKRPGRIEAFDVAHISSTGFAVAVSVWQNGKDLPDEFEHWLSDRTSELETLRAFVEKRLTNRDLATPDLILIDGGRSHLQSGLKAVTSAVKQPFVIAAVKPKGKHSAISHFLTEGGRRIDFDKDAVEFRLLQHLRDEAHGLANATHRLSRDMLHFYELAAILPSLSERERQSLIREFGSIKTITALDVAEFEKRLGKKKAAFAAEDLSRFRNGQSAAPRPLIVPIRFVEIDGAAEDLILIETR